MKDLTLNCIKWFKWKLNETGGKRVVVCTSGGKDSTTMLGVAVEAIGKENVFALLLPNGEQADIDDSYKIVNHLNVPYIVSNIRDAYDAELNSLSGYKNFNLPDEISYDAKVNVQARIRIHRAYFLAQNIGRDVRVVNTCNLSEDVVGYATFYGDSAGDFSPFGKLTTDEVMEIGDDLSLPYELIHKVPSDGLCGKTDEQNLGFTYKEINELIRKGKVGPHYSQIMDKYWKNLYKTQILNLDKFDPGLYNYFEGKVTK